MGFSWSWTGELYDRTITGSRKQFIRWPRNDLNRNTTKIHITTRTTIFVLIDGSCLTGRERHLERLKKENRRGSTRRTYMNVGGCPWTNNEPTTDPREKTNPITNGEITKWWDRSVLSAFLLVFNRRSSEKITGWQVVSLAQFVLPVRLQLQVLGCSCRRRLDRRTVPVDRWIDHRIGCRLNLGIDLDHRIRRLDPLRIHQSVVLQLLVVAVVWQHFAFVGLEPPEVSVMGLVSVEQEAHFVSMVE